MNINPWRGWFYLVKRDDMPNVPYVDLRDCGLTGQLAQPDDPKMIETLGRGFELGVQPGLWVPDRPNETAAGYVARVADAITAIQQAKLGPNLVVLNPEWNAIGKGDFDRTKPARPAWWTWLDDALTQLRTRYPSRLFDVSIPAMQDYVNWPAVFRLNMRARLQLYGGSSGELRFDPAAAIERLRINSYLDPSDADPRRVCFDVGARHADYYLEPVTVPGLPASTPRIVAAGLRGVALWTIDEDFLQRSYVKYRALIDQGAIALR